MVTFGDIIFRKINFFLNIMELMGSKGHYKKRRPSVMACTQFAVHYINWFSFKFRFWIKATMCLSRQNDPIMQMILQSSLWALYIETYSCTSQKKLAAQPRRLLKLLSWTFSCSAHFCCAFFKFHCFLFLLFSLVSVVFSISTGFYSTSIIVFQYFHCVFLTFVLFFLLALGLIQPLLVLFNLFSFLLFSLFCFLIQVLLIFFLFMLFF